MKDTLQDLSLGKQIRTDIDASDQEVVRQAEERIDQHFEAAKEVVSDTLKRAENLVKRGRNTTQGYLEDFTYQVRHKPLSGMALAAIGGAITGGLLALLLARPEILPKATSVD